MFLLDKAMGSTILQQVTVPLKTNQECQAVYTRRVTISGDQVNKTFKIQSILPTVTGHNLIKY